MLFSSSITPGTLIGTILGFGALCGLAPFGVVVAALGLVGAAITGAAIDGAAEKHRQRLRVDTVLPGHRAAVRALKQSGREMDARIKARNLHTTPVDVYGQFDRSGSGLPSRSESSLYESKADFPGRYRP